MLQGQAQHGMSTIECLVHHGMTICKSPFKKLTWYNARCRDLEISSKSMTFPWVMGMVISRIHFTTHLVSCPLESMTLQDIVYTCLQRKPGEGEEGSTQCLCTRCLGCLPYAKTISYTGFTTWLLHVGAFILEYQHILTLAAWLEAS